MAKKLEDLLREAGISASYTQRNFGQGVGTSSSYENKKDIPTAKKLYSSMGLSDSQIGSKGLPKADTTWKTDLLKPLSAKKYGSSYDKKLNKIFGDPWAAKDFERFMNYRNANKTIQTNAANVANSEWENSHKNSLDNLSSLYAARDASRMTDVSGKASGLELKQLPGQPQQSSNNANNIQNEKILNKIADKNYSTQQKVKEVSQERSGFLGFLDSTLGRIGDATHAAVFGQDFVNAENENYQKLAFDNLSKNPTDEKAIRTLQMLSTTARAPKNKTEKAADIIGNIAGEIAPYTVGGAYGMADMALGKLGLNAMNPIAKDVTRGFIAGNVAGNEKAFTRAMGSGEVPTLKEHALNLLTEGALAGGGDALFGGILRNINLKGQLGKVLEGTGSRPFTEQEFQKALQEAYAPKGNYSNVLADKGPVFPKPFEPKYNLPPQVKPMDSFVPNELPKDDWLNFAQQGSPKARGLVDKIENPARYAKEDLNNLADTILSGNVRKGIPTGGFNQRLLDVQKEMQASSDRLAMYGKDITPEEAYLKVRKDGDPATFDELINQAVKEADKQAYDKSLPGLLRNDPKIAEALQKLNALGQAKKEIQPLKTPEEIIQELTKKQNLQSQESLNLLNDVKKEPAVRMPNGNTLNLPDLKNPNQKPLGNLFSELKPVDSQPNKSLLETLKVEPKKKSLLSISDVFGHLKQIDEAAPSSAPKTVTESAAISEPVVLKSVNPTKDVNKMSKEELQKVYQQLENKQKSFTKTKSKSSKQKIQEIQDDMDKVQSLLMKLDLQLFGKSEPKPITSVENTVSSSPKKKKENPIKEIKDINQFQVGTKNIYELADRLPKQQGNVIRKSLDSAKKNYVSHLEQETNDLYEKVVKNLSIKAGSKESALVQDFGEKTLGKKYLVQQGKDLKEVSPEELAKANLDQLKELHSDKWEKIVAADQFFREKYDTLIDQVNAVREQIYPNSPDRIVPKRNDYYHHFNELTGMEGVKNLFSNTANIDPHLEGLSPFTQPKSKWQGFMQKRGMGPYKSDAVGGFLKYVKAASHSINVDPVIPVLRKTAKELADATTTSRNANNIIESLVDHANDLAGKTNPYDRVAQKMLGRGGAWKAVNWLNSRVRGNMILGNLGTVVAQYGNIPWGIGKTKLHSIPGLKNTIEQSMKELLHGDKSAPIYESVFMKERYGDHLFRRFDQKLIQQPKRFAVWAMETADKQATRFIWNSMYSKGVKEGVKDAIKYADYETRKVVAGRGVGEVPILQKSKTFQVFAPFTLEVGNQWKNLSDMIGKKDAAGLITALVASYGINKAAEEIRGSTGVSYDPLDAIIDGYIKQDGNAGQKSMHALASLLGESVGNIPGGNILTQMADTEKKVPFTDLKYKDLFGERNPNRYGSGLVLSKALEDPAFTLMPFGASQMRKSSKGLDALVNEGVYKKGNNPIPYPLAKGPKEELMYPVNPNAWETLKLPLFGPGATRDAKNYYDNRPAPLTDIQTNAYNRLKKEGMGPELDLYNFLRVAKTKPSEKGKLTKIEKDEKLSDAEKIRRMIELIEKEKK